MLLAECKDGTGFHIFTDRFYTSPKLATELRKLNIHITGTVQVNRAIFPKKMKAQTEIVSAQKLSKR